MIRDFTQENYTAFKQLIKTINPDNNNQIAAMAEAIISNYSKPLSRLGGAGAIRTIASNNIKAGQLITASDSKVQNSFDDISAQDTQFEQDTYDALVILQKAMSDLAGIKKAVSDKIDGGLSFWDAFTSDTIRETTSESSEKLKLKTTDLVNKEVKTLSDDALTDYNDKDNPKIKKLAELVNFMRNHRDFLSEEHRSALENTEKAVLEQRDTQRALKGTMENRPPVREISDYLAEMASKITNQEFSPTYLTEDGREKSPNIIQKKGSDSIKRGSHSKKDDMLVDYLPKAAKQEYLQQWDYPEDGRAGHYGISSCTWLIAGGYRSYYKDDLINTKTCYMLANTKKPTKAITGNSDPKMVDKDNPPPISTAVFSADDHHVGLSVGEMITYDFTYVENAVIQGTSGVSKKGKGVMVTDMTSGTVYCEYYEKGEYKVKEGKTQLVKYSYLPHVKYP